MQFTLALKNRKVPVKLKLFLAHTSGLGLLLLLVVLACFEQINSTSKDQIVVSLNSLQDFLFQPFWRKEAKMIWWYFESLLTSGWDIWLLSVYIFNMSHFREVSLSQISWQSLLITLEN